MKLDPHYLEIKKFYGEQRAKRSGVKLINHIDEGLKVLELISAPLIARQAYCLHPILQADEAISKFVGEKEPPVFFYKIDFIPVVLAVEYRRVANSYLSRDKIEGLVDTPIEEVWQMLIADKVQNRKDFELYHEGKHERSAELTRYFRNWMKILDITEDHYQNFKSILMEINHE